jgi:hypothetical protein
VSEPHFKEEKYIEIPNYITYAANHPDGRANADSAIITRKYIKYHEHAKYKSDHIQTTNMSIDDWAENLTISASYCSPRNKIEKEYFNAFINSLRHRFWLEVISMRNNNSGVPA